MQTNIAISPASNEYKDSLLAIIDSKIQYIGFELKQLFRGLDQAEGKEGGTAKSDSTMMEYEPDAVFLRIEQSTRQKSRLLVLRKFLSLTNVKLVYQLLEKDAYLQFSVVSLQELLSKRV